jgi:PAS domain S-box-containing protein
MRFDGLQGAAVGVLAAAAAVVAKLLLNEVAGGDTGYILMVAAVIAAAWIGGVPGGVAATIVGVTLNTIIFVTNGRMVDGTPPEAWRQALFVVTGIAASVLLASRRSSRDRLAAALVEVSNLADEVDSRDRRLEIMLAASGTGFWEWDITTGKLTWSGAIFEQHGLDPGGDAPDFPTYRGMIHEDDRERFTSAIEAAVAGGGDLDIEFRLVWADGSEHWTHGAGRVFRDMRGRPIRMIGTGQDITDRRHLEADRDRLLADERRAGEFREAFIDVISHELRTPITTILGTTEILSRADRVMDPEVRATLLADARAESERLYRLVEDLLVLSRVERGRLVVEAEPLQPRRLLDRVVAQMTAELPSVRISLDAPTSLPIVSGEATYIEQILRNLLENAAKYSPAGTLVEVSAEHVGDEVVIAVLDDGPGIPPESVDHIFDLFYRDPGSARSVAGSGIGLFVCRNLAEAMGGRMVVGPGPDGGSRFTFSLPVLGADEDAVTLS